MKTRKFTYYTFWSITGQLWRVINNNGHGTICYKRGSVHCKAQNLLNEKLMHQQTKPPPRHHSWIIFTDFLSTFSYRIMRLRSLQWIQNESFSGDRHSFPGIVQCCGTWKVGKSNIHFGTASRYVITKSCGELTSPVPVWTFCDTSTQFWAC